MHGIFYRLARYVTTHAVNQLDRFIDCGRLLGALGLGVHFDVSERLALLAQYAHHIGRGACAKPDEHQLHRSRRGIALAIGIHHECVPARALHCEPLTIDPLCAGFYHAHLLLSVCGSGWISTLKSCGASCLKRISRAVANSCTLESGRSSDMVAWQERYSLSRTRLNVISCRSSTSGNSPIT